MDVVLTYDSVEVIPHPDRGSVTLGFRKRVNGVMLVVEEVRRGAGEVVFSDLYIQKAAKK